MRDRQSLFDKNFTIVTAVIAIMIVYGSLYPFAFRIPSHGVGPVPALLGSWAETPGRGDFLSNILLYMPLGYFGFHAFRREVGGWKRAGLVILLGITLSLSMELTQYYDAGRETAATDVYSNAIGTVLGVLVGPLVGNGKGLFRGSIDRLPLMFLVAWAAFRLFPYVPTIDLHKYWNALKPVVLHPSLTPLDLFRHTAMWLTVGALIEGIFVHRRASLLFPAFAASVLVLKIFIVDATLSVAEITGAGVAILLWFALGISPRLRLLAISVLLSAYIVTWQLESFHTGTQAAVFGWIPFLSFMQGSIEIDVMSFLEKFFFYGSWVWLLDRAGLRLRTATVSVALLLFATSWVEVSLAGRSAEITDAIMALLIGGIIALVRPLALVALLESAGLEAPGAGPRPPSSRVPRGYRAVSAASTSPSRSLPK